MLHQPHAVDDDVDVDDADAVRRQAASPDRRAGARRAPPLNLCEHEGNGRRACKRGGVAPTLPAKTAQTSRRLDRVAGRLPREGERVTSRSTCRIERRKKITTGSNSIKTFDATTDVRMLQLHLLCSMLLNQSSIMALSIANRASKYN